MQTLVIEIIEAGISVAATRIGDAASSGPRWVHYSPTLRAGFRTFGILRYFGDPCPVKGDQN